MNRWTIAAAAVLTHLCLGSVYAWSVFVVPIQQVTQWDKPELTWAFSTAIATLGLTAAFASGICRRLGPRASVAISAVLFAAGVASAGMACQMRSLMLLYGGFGVIGGIGLGMGYAPPVTTLLRWFPDRRGLATGMAVCGFGLGALIAARMAESLLPRLGCISTFYLMASLYLPAILLASLAMRLPPDGWKPEGWQPESDDAMEGELVLPLQAMQTGRFWLIWLIFFINIAAGIMLIPLAKPMAQEIAGLSPEQAGWVVAIMGMFNGAGRLGWSAASDYLGRPRTFLAMLILQIALFVAMGSGMGAIVFVGCLWLVLSCYGGGFALTPALVADLFGTRSAPAIYGLSLTAWSAGALCSPLGAYLHEQLQSYRAALFAAAGLLVLGAVLSALLTALSRRPAQEPLALQRV